MGALTEAEIFDCLATNFRLAAESAETLAVKSQKGPTYDGLRKQLKLIEGAARQASAWREDTRWLQIGLVAAEAHKRAGDWLRGYKDPKTGRRIPFAPGQQNPLFLMLAANLRAAMKLAEMFRTAKTGKVGMILPEAMPSPHRDTRPVQVAWPARMSKGGIILPAGHA